MQGGPEGGNSKKEFFLGIKKFSMGNRNDLGEVDQNKLERNMGANASKSIYYQEGRINIEFWGYSRGGNQQDGD